MPGSQKIANRQQQKTSLRQKISPQLKKLGQMLEMSNDSLEVLVRSEKDDNPALVDIDVETHEENECLNSSGEGGDDEYRESDYGSDEDMHRGPETEEEMMRNDYASEDDIPTYRCKINNYSPEDGYEPVVVDNGTSLYDVLSEQLMEYDLSEDDMLIAQYIIGTLDGDGLLRDSILEISNNLINKESKIVSIKDIKRVLDIIQGLEPVGIAAVNLQQCLLTQLNSKTETPTVEHAKTVVEKYFDEYSKKHYPKIISAMSITDAEMKDVQREILTLNPRPGAAYSGSSYENAAQQITPDFDVEVEDDIISISLFNNIPDLQIAESYKMMNDTFVANPPKKKSEEDAAKLIRKNCDDAKEFIELLKQRQNTLFRVFMAIVHYQKEFFLTGDEAKIRPMVLKDIAEKTGLDLTIISRATASKYVNTRWGIFSLKFFFSEALVNKDGDESSAREVMAILKEIIEAEDKRKPYSDEKLCDLLKKRKYNIARRTVAKYRDRMEIPVARLRKQV